MKKMIRLLVAATATLSLATALIGQQPKSQKEVEALMAIQNAATVDARIEAAQKLITEFADTEFKSWALFNILQSYEMKGDVPNMIVYAEQLLEAKASPFEAASAHVRIANGIARQTKEFDLDREEKLKKVEEHANKAIEMLATAPKMNEQIPDDQWQQITKAEEGIAYDALAQAEFVRKKYVEAAGYFMKAIEAQPDPVRMLKAGNAYRLGKKYDEAIAILDKAIASPDSNDQVRNLAETEKKAATQAKEAGA